MVCSLYCGGVSPCRCCPGHVLTPPNLCSGEVAICDMPIRMELEKAVEQMADDAISCCSFFGHMIHPHHGSFGWWWKYCHFFCHQRAHPRIKNPPGLTVNAFHGSLLHSVVSSLSPSIFSMGAWVLGCLGVLAKPTTERIAGFLIDWQRVVEMGGL